MKSEPFSQPRSLSLPLSLARGCGDVQCVYVWLLPSTYAKFAVIPVLKWDSQPLSLAKI